MTASREFVPGLQSGCLSRSHADNRRKIVCLQSEQHPRNHYKDADTAYSESRLSLRSLLACFLIEVADQRMTQQARHRARFNFGLPLRPTLQF